MGGCQLCLFSANLFLFYFLQFQLHHAMKILKIKNKIHPIRKCNILVITKQLKEIICIKLIPSTPQTLPLAKELDPL
jgi:hypothetical protein